MPIDYIHKSIILVGEFCQLNIHIWSHRNGHFLVAIEGVAKQGFYLTNARVVSSKY